MPKFVQEHVRLREPSVLYLRLSIVLVGTVELVDILYPRLVEGDGIGILGIHRVCGLIVTMIFLCESPFLKFRKRSTNTKQQLSSFGGYGPHLFITNHRSPLKSLLAVLLVIT